MDNAEFRVLAAMFKAGLQRKPKLAPTEHARRLALEAERQRRRYCDAFALWRDCRRNPCRRHRACGGDPHLCLQRALGRVPHTAQVQARNAILKATPANIGAPERFARGSMPNGLCE
jgi:hypothetical protein